MSSECVFCRIVAGTAAASVVHEDDNTIGFMDIEPVRPGQCLLIPKVHIDHFTDLPDDLSAHILIMAQRIGRTMLEVLQPTPLRIGYVVHGFGVSHAHLVIVPQYDDQDITSLRYQRVENGAIVFDSSILPRPTRAELDRIAASIAIKPLQT